ncbi:hypothetical protein HHI36_010154 [Cryptolaemus montrouzieri]|uniref:Nitrilase and fragile histidine triad fusion protein NitFhit n=1 Tax=Cryptolaemus montrouzieri TaxID=559131 RepID=A0ABD2MHV6_9CUCU
MLCSQKLFNIICRNKNSVVSRAMCDVAVCQFTATNNKINNLRTVEKLVTEAARKGAKVAFLPEGCDFIGNSSKEIKELAETLDGPTMKEYKKIAVDLKVWLSIGGFHEINSTSAKIFNSHIVINDNGDIVSVYRKLHLFDVFIPEKNIELIESKYVDKGNEIVPSVQTPAGPLALSICYDVRFPELSIIQRENGALILTYPSAFTYLTGKSHWEVLLRSRAIENQCYVVAAAQYGKHNEKRISHGHSLIIDPWGKILAECPSYKEGIESNESVAIARIDPEYAANIRKEMPVFNHRRKDIYELKIKCENCIPILKTDEFKFSHIDIPEPTVFFKSKLCYGFTNLRCVVPGHVLVTTRRVVTRLEHCTSDEVSDLFQTVVFIQKMLEKHYSATSSTICCQDGKEAGQTVSHVHVHILPRKLNDFDNNDDIYHKLASHDKNDDSMKNRDLSDMIEEAQLLRNYFY